MINVFLLRLLHRWRQFIVIAAPVIFLPLILYKSSQESKCAYVVLLVATYWVTSAIPLAVASLLPLVLFPLLGILSSDEVCHSYMRESNIMGLAGFMTAIGIENSNLHRRIALRILLVAGTSPKWLMLSFMITSAFLSMWISNTSTTALMVPIVDSILQELRVTSENDVENGVNHQEKNNGYIEEQEKTKSSIELVDEVRINENKMKNFRKCTLLSVAYSASLGGSSTATGTGPNLILMETLANSYKDAETGLNYATWMLYAIPCSILCLILTWLWLQIVFLGPRSLCEGEDKENKKRVKAIIRKEYEELGSINFHEIIISFLFILLILLWVFRRPEFMPGWSALFPKGFVKDSVAGIGISFLMFALPSRLDFLCCDFSQDKPPPSALNWPVVQSKIPWGIILLMGGGFALAEGSKESGLSDWVGSQFAILSPLPPAAIVSVLVFVCAIVTEVASNTATATILMPVLRNMSKNIRVHPLYLMLPSATACSFAFMLPSATPSNAIVAEVSGMSNTEMMKPGIVANIICLGVLILMANTLGVYLFNLNEYPTWAT